MVARNAGAIKPGSVRSLVREALHEHGMRCTEVRVHVLEALAAADGHLTVAQIHQSVAGNLPGADLSSVYRTIIAFQEIGLAHRTDVADQAATYGIAHSPHHHAVCTRCGAIAEVPAATLAATVTLAEQATGYTLNNNASLQLHGLCRTCQTEQAATTTPPVPDPN